MTLYVFEPSLVQIALCMHLPQAKIMETLGVLENSDSKRRHWDKLWRLSLQHGDSVTCTMCLFPILLNNVVIPENRVDIQQKHI